MNAKNYGPTVQPQVQVEQTERGPKLKIWGARAMYANVNSPRKDKSGKETGYDCEFLVPKNAPGADAMKAAIIAFGKRMFPSDKFKFAIIADPDREIAQLKEDGQTVPAQLLEKAGHYVIKANSGVSHPPTVKGVIYSGCYAGAVIMLAKYDTNDSTTGQPVRGIKGYLNGVQFHGDGERIGGGACDVEDELGMPTPQQAPPALPGDDDDFAAGAYTGSSMPKRHTSDDDLPFG